jgi:hypothetical protein
MITADDACGILTSRISGQMHVSRPLIIFSDPGFLLDGYQLHVSGRGELENVAGNSRF